MVLNVLTATLAFLSVHDVSSGGILLSIAEMSIYSQIGIKIQKPKTNINIFEYFFGEDQGRYIIEVNEKKVNGLKKYLNDNNIHYEFIGITQKNYFEIEKNIKISVNELYNLNNKWYYNY